MERLKKLMEPVLWFLAAVFLTWGWQLLGTAYLVVALVGLLMAFLVVSDMSENVQVDDFVWFCLAAGMGGVASAIAETLLVGCMVLVVFFVLVWLSGRREEKTCAQAVGSVVLAIGSMFVSIFYPPAYMEDKKAYEEFYVEVAKTEIPQEMKAKIKANPFILKSENNFIKDEIQRLDSLTKTNQDSTMAVINRMSEIKAAENKESNKELAKFDGKTEILRIKRIWLTSDVLPWTYSMWKTIEYNLSMEGRFGGRGGGMFSRGVSGQFKASGKVTPNINGESNYVGNDELSYINILFSDNSYQRFSMRDNPEWLLAREGERARVEYRVEYAHETRLSLEDLVKSCGSVSKTYVPLFK